MVSCSGDFVICAEGISQAETLAFQFGAAREPELSYKRDARGWL